MEETVVKDEKIEKNKKKNKDKEVIKELNLKIKELEDKNIRVTAEMINTVRRKEEENSRLLKYASEEVFIDLLQVVDNFERALSINSESEDVKNYQKGFNMIYDGLKNLLNKYEVKEIEALDKEFDPTYHQAVMTGEKEGVDSNIVIEVMQKGYTYKDKVIRPVMVKVSK